MGEMESRTMTPCSWKVYLLISMLLTIVNFHTLQKSLSILFRPTILFPSSHSNPPPSDPFDRVKGIVGKLSWLSTARTFPIEELRTTRKSSSFTQLC